MWGACLRLILSHQYPAKLDDMDQVVRIGHGICGEVYRMRHKPTAVKLASKVWKIPCKPPPCSPPAPSSFSSPSFSSLLLPLLSIENVMAEWQQGGASTCSDGSRGHDISTQSIHRRVLWISHHHCMSSSSALNLALNFALLINIIRMRCGFSWNWCLPVLIGF